MAAKKAQSKVSDSQQTLNELKTHQKECTLRYERIEERLNEGSEKFKKLEMMIWGVYPFMVATIVAAKFL
jgi:hypothetical protein|tara:strand:- start:206 stop:415 length:210 start_codon:yes stop_codon:yes gene_type:complete